jgi:hypothetical protein
MDIAVDQQEKREVQRFDLRLHTVLQELRNRARETELYTRDISSDGAYLRTDSPLPLNTPVELTFYLPVQQQIRSKIQTNGRVIRSEDGGIAVRFEAKYQILAL